MTMEVNMNAIRQITSPDDFEAETYSLDRLFMELESHLDLALPEDFGLVSSEEVAGPVWAPSELWPA